MTDEPESAAVTAFAGLSATGLLAVVAGGLAYRRAVRTVRDHRIG